MTQILKFSNRLGGDVNAKVRWFPITFGSFSFGDMKVTLTFIVVVILPRGSWPHTTYWNKSSILNYMPSR